MENRKTHQVNKIKLVDDHGRKYTVFEIDDHGRKYTVFEYQEGTEKPKDQRIDQFMRLRELIQEAGIA